MTYSGELDEFSKQALYWDACESETLEWEDIDSAIEAAINYLPDHSPYPSQWDRAITVRGLNRYAFCDVEINGIADDVIERLTEELDQEHGDPDGDSPRYTKNDEAKALAVAFVEGFLKNYKPWDCFVVASVDVDVPRWVRECRPEWLEDAAVRAFVEAEG
jgi:hypothetical protein